MNDEPLSHRIADLRQGAAVGIASVFVACICGWGAVGLVFLMGGFMDLDASNRPGPNKTALGLTAAQFDALAPYLAFTVALSMGALAGRVVLGRWRGALNGAGAVAFTVVTTLGVSTSPFTRTELSTPVAAILSAAVWGAALLRTERDVPAG